MVYAEVILPVSLFPLLYDHPSQSCLKYKIWTTLYTQKGIQMRVELFLLFIYSRWYGFSFKVSNNVSFLRESGKVNLKINFT